MNLLKNIILCSLFVFLVSSCSLTMQVSKHHIGYHYLGEQGQVYSTVAKRTDDDAKAFEDKCLQAFLSKDVDQLMQYFAPKFKAQMTKHKIEMVTDTLTNKVSFNGKIEPVAIQNFKNSELTENTDNYEIYDYIRADFILYGNPGAVIQLYTTKVNSKLMLCGFHILGFKDNEINPEIKLGGIYPETENKSGL